MGKVIATKLNAETLERWNTFLDKHPDKSQSELLQAIVIMALNKEAENPLPSPSLLQQARKDNPFLNEKWKCKERSDWILVKDLICVTDPDVECRHTECQRYIKRRLGIA